MSKKSKLSVVVPVFNEEGNIAPLLRRVIPIIDKHDYEIIFVNDGSQDRTSQEVREFAKQNNKIKLISFVRNFGQQTAFTCGYDAAQGDAVITMDADLQDPPEIIEDMITKWEEGYKVVYAKRSVRHESFFKTATANIFYSLINLLSDTEIPQNVGDFRLIDRKVVNMLNSMPEKSRFLRGLVAWGGFESTFVTFERKEREHGETHYPFSKMVAFALDGIVSFSAKPLRFATYLGFVAALLGFAGVTYAVALRLFFPDQYWVAGWATTFVGIMFFGGVQLITIGIIGEYISRIYAEIQDRPQYIIAETVNLD